MKSTSRGALVAAALMAALGGSTGVTAFTDGALRITAPKASSADQQGQKAARTGDQTARLDLNQRTPTRRGQRRAGPGWTNAHAKRVARKARNVKRHRAANR